MEDSKSLKALRDKFFIDYEIEGDAKTEALILMNTHIRYGRAKAQSPTNERSGAQEVLDKVFDERRIRKGWLTQTHDAVIEAMHRFASQQKTDEEIRLREKLAALKDIILSEDTKAKICEKWKEYLESQPPKENKA